jgi:hypothetical protein
MKIQFILARDEVGNGIVTPTQNIEAKNICPSATGQIIIACITSDDIVTRPAYERVIQNGANENHGTAIIFIRDIPALGAFSHRDVDIKAVRNEDRFAIIVGPNIGKPIPGQLGYDRAPAIHIENVSAVAQIIDIILPVVARKRVIAGVASQFVIASAAVEGFIVGPAQKYKVDGHFVVARVGIIVRSHEMFLRFGGDKEFVTTGMLIPRNNCINIIADK